HAPVRLGKNDRLLHSVAGRLDRAGEHASEHYGVAAEQQRLYERAIAFDPTIGNQRNTAARRFAAFDERRRLRHAEIRVEARGAAAARPDANLHAMHAAL